MSTLFLHVGQAGNQLGQHFWSRAANHAYNNTDISPLSNSPFFSASGQAHAILVDTEPKVLRSLYDLSLASILENKDNKQSSSNKQNNKRQRDTESLTVSSSSSLTRSLFRSSSFFYDQYGRGNNWSLGYAGREGGETNPMIQPILDCVRRESERMDVFDSILMMHSMAGGTGAGMGCHLLEALRDQYTQHYLATVSITPYDRGETPLQQYNTVLTMAHLQQYADAILLYHNDQIMALLSNMIHHKATERHHQTGTQHTQNTTYTPAPLPFSVMNSYIADSVCDVILPIHNKTNEAQASYHSLSSLPALLATFTPLPGLKLLESYTSSGLVLPSEHEPLSWSQMAETLSRSYQYAGNATAAAASANKKVIEYGLIVRGASVLPVEEWDRAKIEEKLSRLVQPVAWNTRPAAVPTRGRIHSHSRPMHGASRSSSTTSDRWLMDAGGCSLSYQPCSLSLLINHARPVGWLQSTLRSAQHLYDKRAYVHCYERYRWGPDEFDAAFDTVHNIIDDYNRQL